MVLALAFVLAAALVAAPAAADTAPAATPAAADTTTAAGTTAAGTTAADTTVTIPTPPLPTGTLRVETRPPGLEVEVDGRPAGRSPAGPLALTAGVHRIRVIPADPRRFGTPVTETSVQVESGLESVVRLDLRPPVVLRTEPEPALVTLLRGASADTLLGSTPLSVRPSVLEPFHVRFTREAFADTTVPGPALLARGEPLRVSLRRIGAAPARTETSERVPLYRKRWMQWTLVGIGAVLTGAAAVWHREADRTYDEYLASSDVEEIPDLYDRTVELDRRATASFLAGQAALITGGLLLLTGQSH